MAITSIDLPVPVADGVGAAQDVSTLGLHKAIIVSGTFDANASIIIEAAGSAAGGDDDEEFVQIAITRKPDVILLPTVAQRMRVRVDGLRPFSPFSPNVDVAAEAGTPSFQQLDVPSGEGVGSATDVSALPDFRSIFISGTFTGNVVIEGSQDNSDWAQIGPSVTKPDTITKPLPVKHLRVRRKGPRPHSVGQPVVYVGGIASTGGEVPDPLDLSAGTAGAPSLTFGTVDTGLYAPAAGQIGISLGGVQAVQFSDGQVLVSDGTAAAPSIARLSAPGTGLNFNGSTLSYHVSGGSAEFFVTATEFTFNTNAKPNGDGIFDLGSASAGWRDIYVSDQVLGDDGSAAAPTYSFQTAATTGMYRPTNGLGLSVAGAANIEMFSVYARFLVGWSTPPSEFTAAHTLTTSELVAITAAATIELTLFPTDGEVHFIHNNTGAALTVQRNGKNINGAAADDSIPTQEGRIYIFSSNNDSWWTF